MATETDDYTTEEWLYAGQRLNAKEQLYHVWVDPSGEQLGYRKLPAGMPGQAYHVDVDRTNGTITVKGAPRYRAELATRQATPAQIETWRAETAAARQILEAKRAEKNAAGDDELQQALEVIRRHRHRIKSYAKRGAFDSYVLGELGRPPAKQRDEEVD